MLLVKPLLLYGMFPMGFGLILIPFIAIGMLPVIFYLLTLQNTLKVISPPNRTMRPGQVWLMLIPFFRIVWNFIMVTNISDSIQNEFRSKGIHVEERPTYGVGLAMCICECCFIIPFLNILAMFGALICWIIYWIKVNEYKNKMLQLPGLQSGSSIFGNQNSSL